MIRDPRSVRPHRARPSFAAPRLPGSARTAPTLPILSSILTLIFSLPLAAQAPPPGADAVAAKRAAIEKVAFLAGEWEGGGYFEYSPGKQQRFQGMERVETRLGGQILLFEGRHLAAEGERKGEVVHEAFAVLSWDDRAKSYRFRTYTSEGRGGEFDGRVEGGAFVWTLPNPEGRTRYTLKLDPQGRWFETGESSSDGKSWKKFFEMTLTKRGAAPKP